MKDEERIEMYYKFGVLDWRCEETELARKAKKTKDTARSLAIIPKMSSLWLMIKEFCAALIKVKEKNV